MTQNPSDTTGRDEREGHYTETDGEEAEVRQVHGQYTETEGDAPDPSVEGAYTDEELPADAPEGEYTDKDE
ncbi:hypothetical protein ASF62_15370 [Leifsonia sp. Leaf325]|nr:hypothetical protein [Leifsonia sp. Leaf325]KQQ93117.1 hypothetical protein ASF62_15370 [Leifsonia sp. Leaf325]